MMHGVFGRCVRWCHNKSVGLLLLRLALGSFFLVHGVNKLQNMEMVVQFFGSIGLSPFWATLVAWVEVLAGAAFVLGGFLWVAGPAIAIDMAVAIWKVTSQTPGDALTNFIAGWGPNVVYAAAALCLAWCGAGRWSVTAWMMRRKGMEKLCRECRSDHGMGHNCPECPPGHMK